MLRLVAYIFVSSRDVRIIGELRVPKALANVSKDFKMFYSLRPLIYLHIRFQKIFLVVDGPDSI